MLAAAEAYAASNQATIITPFILAGAMAPVTSAGVAAQTLGRGARRHGLHAAGAPRRPGDPRLVRQLDVDADGRADVRHARAGPRAVHARRAGPPARCAVPQRRLADGVEDPRRPGGLRERGDAAADGDGRRQLRAPRRRLARGRAVDRLREVRARRRSARHDDHVLQGPRPVGERPGARRHHREPARAALPRRRPTRSPTSRRRSTAPTPPTTPASSSGPRTAASTPRKRANKLWKQRLAAYEPPPLDEAIDEELQDFIARRKAVLPDSLT